jgi:Zn-dependent protease
MRKDSWDLGTWGRIPVQMHWTVLLSFAWLYLFTWSLVGTLVASVALFALFVAHEYGHVFVLRRRKVAVTGITLYGIHGETQYNEYSAKPGDVTAAAWGGVAAQLLILAVATVVRFTVDFSSIPAAAIVAGPVLMVFTTLNVFLIIIALLPIGPFDGHAAWQVIPRMRNRKKKSRKATVTPRRKAAPEPEVQLGRETQEELDSAAEKEAADLIARLTGKSDSTEGRR